MVFSDNSAGIQEKNKVGGTSGFHCIFLGYGLLEITVLILSQLHYCEPGL